ncbi:MAG: SemiSWEET family transporter [Candidatus Saccharibacteria bacterium]|nr:SemiSWEET family transporter [Candidatus Saccharibacteria bacterium]
MNPEIIGIAAGVFTTFATLPQIIKMHKIKEARDISLLMFLSIIVGGILWLIYGLLIHSTALIGWNVIALILNGTIVGQTIYYDSKSKNIDYL